VIYNVFIKTLNLNQPTVTSFLEVVIRLWCSRHVKRGGKRRTNGGVKLRRLMKSDRLQLDRETRCW